MDEYIPTSEYVPYALSASLSAVWNKIVIPIEKTYGNAYLTKDDMSISHWSLIEVLPNHSDFSHTILTKRQTAAAMVNAIIKEIESPILPTCKNNKANTT